MTRAGPGIERVPVQCKDTVKISVPCQDDPFGFNSEVVFDDMSVPLRRCTPFGRTADYRRVVTGEDPENAVGQVLVSFAMNGHVCAPIHQTVRNGLPAGLTPEMMDADQRCKKQTQVHPNRKKRKAKRRGRK